MRFFACLTPVSLYFAGLVALFLFFLFSFHFLSIHTNIRTVAFAVVCTPCCLEVNKLLGFPRGCSRLPHAVLLHRLRQ